MKKRPSLRYDNSCMVCGACIAACPDDCIQLKMTDVNYVPYIDSYKCIGCNRCEKACRSINNYHGDAPADSSFYICACKNQAVLNESSSGGMFTLLSDYILENDGIVAAAAYIPEEKKVKHILTDSPDGINKCKKSKYVQSDPTAIYDAVKNIDNNQLLVVGTPCQISPLFLKYGNRDNILFVDLFCHGVSNAGVFKTYLDTFDKETRWLDFRYCSAESAGNNFNFKLYFKDLSSSVESYDENLFCRLFISSANLKKTCFNCPFSKYRHLSDITIGDWDDHKYAEQHGITASHPSIAAVNTTKGAEAFENIKERMCFYRITDNTRERIKNYFPDHMLVKGKWGYDSELSDSFIKDYKARGFTAAAYESLEKENIKTFDTLGLNGKRVWLYGAGVIGKRINKLIKYLYMDCIICGFIESSDNQLNRKILNVSVYGLSHMEGKYDKDDIFIITARKEYQDVMTEGLIKMGVDRDHIAAVKETP